MRSQLSKLPKDILIEIIEKGFNFEDLKLSDLKKKEKEVHEIINIRKEDIFNQIRNIKISDYTTSVSDRFIYIRKQYENCDGYIKEMMKAGKDSFYGLYISLVNLKKFIIMIILSAILRTNT